LYRDKRVDDQEKEIKTTTKEKESGETTTMTKTWWSEGVSELQLQIQSEGDEGQDAMKRSKEELKKPDDEGDYQEP
jgi:hypothetical protein